MYNIYNIEKDFYKLVDMWLEKPNPNTSKDLNFVYANNEKYKNLDIANMVLYRLTLTDNRIESFDDYAKFFEEYSTLNDYDKNVYLKVLYSKLIVDKTWDSPYLFEYQRFKEQLKEYKKKFSTIKIPVKAPIDYEETPSSKYSGSILPGYEKRWCKKAIKNREKAEKLTEKYERMKAEKILLKNIKKYGDVYSVEQLGLLYKRMARYEDAIKYLEIAKDYANDYDFIKARHDYYLLTEERRFNKHIELANQSKNKKEELDHLYNAYRVSHVRDNIGLRIAKILLEPSTKLTNPKLAKQFLDYHLNYIIGIEQSDKCDEFFSYYAKILYNGTMIKQDKVLAYFCYTCVRNRDEELKNIFDKYAEGELTRTYEILKQKFLEDSKESRENQKIEEQKLEEEKIRLEVEKAKENLLELKRKSFRDIFNLDTDINDFMPKRFIENDENYKKKLGYYKKALESKEEQTIVSNLEKAGELMHTKAMVILFHYYVQKQNIDKAYYWFFKALNFIKYLDIKNNLLESVPLNISALLKYFSKNDKDPKCKEFILNNFDFSSDLGEETIKEFEKYSKNNFFIKTCLYTYYSTRDENKTIDLLYDLSTMDINCDDKEKYIVLYIDKMGGLEAELNDKFVEFILDTKLDKNKYVMYHRARLYNDEGLCKKYNLTTYPNKVFNILYKANENKTLKVEGLNEKVDMWLGNCYEFGNGVSMDLEKASYLYSPYKNNESGSLYMFNHFAFPALFELKNFHKIKDRFLIDIEVADYKTTFEKIKKFYDLGFSFDEVFDSEGKYIGDINYYKVIEKEQEIERKRQEEIKKEQERRRKEELERQEKERKRLEEIKRKQEEKERELQEKINKEKANNSSTLNITNNKVINTTTNKSADERLKEIREKYNCPIAPVRPDKDYNDGLTYKQRVRTYGYDYKVMMKEYDERFKLYEKQKKEYTKRLYEATRSMSWDRVYEKLSSIYNTPTDRFMHLNEFMRKCEELINKRFYTSSTNITLKKISMDYADTFYLERNLASIPCFVEDLVIKIEFGIYASDIESYAGRESYSIYSHMEDFENSDLAKFLTWGEFSSTTNEIGVAIHQEYESEKWDDYTKGKKYLENEFWKIILPIFKTYKIIYEKFLPLGSAIYVVPKNIKINFKFPSFYD